MFEKLNLCFRLFPASLISVVNEIKGQNEVDLLKPYFNYCNLQLDEIMSDLDAITTLNDQDITITQFEDIYEKLILNRVEDITAEMFMIEQLVAVQDIQNKYVKQIRDEIDVVEANLMLIPNKIEKTKCVLYALDKI